MWLGLNGILEHAQLDPEESSACSVEQILFGMEQGIDRPIEFRTVQVLGKSPWGRSFEDIRARLQTDGPAYVEGDGSFVVCGKEAWSHENRKTLWCGRFPKMVVVQPTNEWREPTAENPRPVGVWRIEGSLCDGANGLDSISLIGWAPWVQWQRVFDLLGPTSSQNGPSSPVSVLQFHQFGVYIPLANGVRQQK